MGERKRVLRILEYEGDKPWVDSTLTLTAVIQRGLRDHPLPPGRSVREIARFELEPRQQETEPRYVQVSYLHPHLLGRERWDYIDGIGDLKVGDMVVAHRINQSPRSGIVVAIGKGQRDWHGPYSTITRRA